MKILILPLLALVLASTGVAAEPKKVKILGASPEAFAQTTENYTAPRATRHTTHSASQAEASFGVSDPKGMKVQPASSSLQRVTFGGGCFWCIEAVFQRLVGVKSVVSGYSGGKVPNPTYKQIGTGETGHAEVVQLEFDPQQVSYEKLLEVFWAAHDPTTLNRQGADRGTQYRSIILYENDVEKAAAEKSKAAAQADFKDPIVTEIVPLKIFYKAEDYHQNYYNQNANSNPYCAVVIRPKLQKLLQKGLIKE